MHGRPNRAGGSGAGKVNILTGAPDGDSSGLLDNGFVRLYQDF
jgi:hypothetical protein